MTPLRVSLVVVITLVSIVVVGCIVIPEAVGFISSPISYSIHLDDMTAFLNEHGLVTSIDASRLDFHFKPANTSTPNPHIVSP